MKTIKRFYQTSKIKYKPIKVENKVEDVILPIKEEKKVESVVETPKEIEEEPKKKTSKRQKTVTTENTEEITKIIEE